MQEILSDEFMETEVHTDVQLSMTIREVIVPIRNDKNSDRHNLFDINSQQFRKFYVDRNIRIKGRHMASYGMFTATVISSSCPQWDVGERIECKLCGIKAPNEEDLCSQGIEAMKECIIDKIVEAEIITTVGSIHFVDIKFGGQRLSDCLVAGGIADFDTHCISRSFTNLGRMRSPLRTILRGITSITRGYTANINSNDVNGHMLDLFPKCIFERLVVSAEVRRTGNDNSLQLFNTTLMPPIPGLLYIVLMLFCPAVQIRTDEFLSQLVGIIGGMGCQPDTQPFFPDHDLEVEFDCSISKKDIEKVNQIRELMGTILGVNYSIQYWKLSANEIQKKIRELLFSLLVERKRPYRRPLDYSMDPYAWAQYASGACCGLFIAHRLPKINSRPLLDVNYVRCLLRKERELRDDSKSMKGFESAYCYLCDMLLPSKGHVINHFRTDMHRSNIDVIQMQSEQIR
ncbi:hypothetical protein GJ496_011629 [Pomphorhynchus laevis]|nr:hypothetical protein GJ496_011629 [Pomphorhynchus laevis]